jgi:hypothetical protein
VRIGWITAGGRYLRLVQTTAAEGALVIEETATKGGGPPIARGPVQVAGQQWVDYTGSNGEQAWVRAANGVTWLITGDGTVDEFTALARAIEVAPPLPRTD